jgi:hypothetical protein
VIRCDEGDGRGWFGKVDFEGQGWMMIKNDKKMNKNWKKMKRIKKLKNWN